MIKYYFNLISIYIFQIYFFFMENIKIIRDYNSNKIHYFNIQLIILCNFLKSYIHNQNKKKKKIIL